MAYSRFDDLESEARRRTRRGEDFPNLPAGPTAEAPPPWRPVDPMYVPSGESPYEVDPGTRERFGDPSKVIAQAGQTGKNSGEQPYPEERLPPGWTVEGEERLPQGWTVLKSNRPAPTAGQGNEPAERQSPVLNVGISQIPEDPHERAALRTIRSVFSPRVEGPITKGIEKFGQWLGETVGSEAERFNDIAERAMRTGDIPPGEALEMGLMASPAAPGRLLMRNALQGAQHEIGVVMPRAAEGGQVTQSVARGLSSLPVGGGSLRRAAEETTAGLKEAGTAAAARPTGEAVAQHEAGAAAKRAIGEAGAVAEMEGTKLSPRVLAILKKSDEDAIEAMVKMASSGKTGGDVRTLAAARAAIPAEQMGAVQSAIIGRLGNKAGEFDPTTWIRNYGSLSNEGKNILFGQGNNPLRYHLDSLLRVAREAPSWEQFGRRRATLGTKFGVGTLVGGGIASGWYTDSPAIGALSIVGGLVGMGLLARSLAKPGSAAALASFSQAFTRAARSGFPIQSAAALGIAIRNLNLNLDTDISLQDVLEALKGNPNGQPVEP